MLLQCSTLSYDYGPLVYNDRTQWKCHACHEFNHGSLHRIFLWIFQSIPLISLKLSFKSYHFDFASNLTFFRFRQHFDIVSCYACNIFSFFQSFIMLIHLKKTACLKSIQNNNHSWYKNRKRTLPNCSMLICFGRNLTKVCKFCHVYS